LGNKLHLDKIVDFIPECEPKARLSRWVERWKSDDSDVGKLSALIEKWHGNVWFGDRQAQNDFYERFQEFRKEAVRNIGGMTMNERLYWFGSFDHRDSSANESRGRIRTKLRANAYKAL
jgi:hypothetical protein